MKIVNIKIPQPAVKLKVQRLTNHIIIFPIAKNDKYELWKIFKNHEIIPQRSSICSYGKISIFRREHRFIWQNMVKHFFFEA